MLQIHHDAPSGVPRLDSDAYRLTARDAYLLAALKPAADVDGRKLMALRHQHQLAPADRRPPLEPEQLELAELAHRTGEPVSVLRRLPATDRQQWLARQRQQDATRARAEMLALRQRIADTHHPAV